MKQKLILTIIVVVLGIGIVMFMMMNKPQDDIQENAGSFMNGQAINRTGMVSAYGVISIGMQEENLPISDLENYLEIEEVCVASGESITEQTPLLKFTEKSLQLVQAELDEEFRDADLAYRAGAIEYEQNMISTYYKKETTSLSGKQAQTVYEESVAGLYENVENAKEKLDEANAQIAEYESALSRNSYYEDYKVEEYKKLYDENLAILKQKMEEWGVSWNEVTRGNGMRAGNDLHSQYVTVLSSLYQVLEQNLKDYEQAKADYEDAVQNADYNLKQLKNEANSLLQTYINAQTKYESSLLQAQATKENTLSDASKAESVYEDNKNKAQTDYEELEEAWEEALANLEVFAAQIRDGYFYSDKSGSILRVNTRVGASVSSDSRLFMLRDNSDVTVSLSIPQEDIAKLKIGDSAIVQSTEGGMFTGKIISINPISTSTGKASITYTVVVELSNEKGTLSANETVMVYFGMGEEERRNED